MYRIIRGTHSVSYLNDKEYIGNGLKSRDIYIDTLKIPIVHNDGDGLTNITIRNIKRKGAISKKKITKKDNTSINMGANNSKHLQN